MMQLIVFTGLPGTGKSSLAEAVGRALGIPVFAKDWLEAALVRSHLQPGGADQPNLGYASYELLTTLADRQLALGQSAILDSVASTEAIRASWRDLAARHQAAWRVIECQCSDVAVHQARLSGRQRGIPGWPELDWAEVVRVANYYVPWQEARLVVDAQQPWAENFAATLRYLQAEAPAISPASEGGRPVRQGDVYWVPLTAPAGGVAGPVHPHVVVQDDALNHSRLPSVVVCALTTNMKRAKAPGNVLLEPGEGGLPRQSIVAVSQVTAVDKAQLGAFVGRLSPTRIQQILAGLRFIHTFTHASSTTAP